MTSPSDTPPAAPTCSDCGSTLEYHNRFDGYFCDNPQCSNASLLPAAAPPAERTAPETRRPTGEACPKCGNDKLVFPIGGHPKYANVRTCRCCGTLFITAARAPEEAAVPTTGGATSFGENHERSNASTTALSGRIAARRPALSRRRVPSAAVPGESLRRYGRSHGRLHVRLRADRCARAARWRRSMICPFCKAEHAKSCVTPGPTSSTCMAHTTGHYGEDGEWVRDRDPNWHTTGYSCSRGHRFTVMRRERVMRTL